MHNNDFPINLMTEYYMWPAPAKWGTSCARQASDFTCTISRNQYTLWNHVCNQIEQVKVLTYIMMQDAHLYTLIKIRKSSSLNERLLHLTMACLDKWKSILYRCRWSLIIIPCTVDVGCDLFHQHIFEKVGCQSTKLSAKKPKFFHLVLPKNK